MSNKFWLALGQFGSKEFLCSHNLFCTVIVCSVYQPKPSLKVGFVINIDKKLKCQKLHLWMILVAIEIVFPPRFHARFLPKRTQSTSFLFAKTLFESISWSFAPCTEKRTGRIAKKAHFYVLFWYSNSISSRTMGSESSIKFSVNKYLLGKNMHKNNLGFDSFPWNPIVAKNGEWKLSSSMLSLIFLLNYQLDFCYQGPLNSCLLLRNLSKNMSGFVLCIVPRSAEFATNYKKNQNFLVFKMFSQHQLTAYLR